MPFPLGGMSVLQVVGKYPLPSQPGTMSALTMDFYNRIGMNHLSNIKNELVFSSIKDDLKLVLSEHFEIIWFGKLTQE